MNAITFWLEVFLTFGAALAAIYIQCVRKGIFTFKDFKVSATFGTLLGFFILSIM